MRIALVLAIPFLVLLAFAVACGGDEKEAQVTPTPPSESDGEAEDWQAGEGAEDGEDEGEPPLDPGDSDDDGFDDVVEEDLGSDPSDPASLPETEVVNPGSCTDGVDNDLDGDTDAADDRCPRLSAILDVTPSHYTGPCPARVTYSGFITMAAGSGVVVYEFEADDGGVTDMEPLVFDSPGSRPVSVTYGWGRPRSGWVIVRILEPEEVESNRAEFTIDCCADFDADELCDDDDDDDDNDGFSDADENVYGSDHLDDASVPENDDVNLGSCVDSEDNDGDGLLDGEDPGCA